MQVPMRVQLDHVEHQPFLLYDLLMNGLQK